MEMLEAISSYIHIPFCEHICYYCDFNKVFYEGQPVDEYLEKLDLEMKLWLEKYPQQQTPTIYIGGGTPTSLNDAQLRSLLTSVTKYFDVTTTKEFTVEANPGDLTENKLHIMQEFGVNRLSMGVQTFNDRLLKKIGRKHTVKDVDDTLNFLAKNHFDNVSIDLIYALPGQTQQDFDETLKQALSYDLSHYSMYSLILENKTMFMNWVRKGRLELPSQEEEAGMFALAMDVMRQKGYEQYEVSNFAKPGFQSQHNLVYWNNEYYFGFGAGASGYVDKVRYKNHGPIQHYLNPLRNQQLPILSEETLDQKARMEEEMFLGLRKAQGVSIAHFNEKFGVDFHQIYGSVVGNYVSKGLLNQTDNGYIQLTKKGLFLGNEVFEGFLL